MIFWQFFLNEMVFTNKILKFTKTHIIVKPIHYSFRAKSKNYLNFKKFDSNKNVFNKLRLNIYRKFLCNNIAVSMENALRLLYCIS